MTPRQARVALGGFLLLTIGVTSNALYLQGAVSGSAEKTAAAAVRPEPRPSGALKSAKPVKTPDKAPDRAPDRATDKAAEKAPDKTATADAPQGPAQSTPKTASKSVKVRMVRVATVGETRAEEADADTVRAVQEELNRQGYGPIEADGVMRQPTRAAIMAFEHDHRLGLTGEASQAMLKQLVFGTPETEGAAGDIEVRSPHAEAIIKQIQQSLGARGYRPGAVDGQISAETVAAIRTFETDQGLVPKGRISAIVLERLQTGIAQGGKHPAQ
jgi:peptidoglycan hydrolase-like protein with peptidoglycan-binding domain